MTGSKRTDNPLSNGDKRQEFLDAYHSWGVWLTTPELDLTYYRCALSNGSCVIAMEHKTRIYHGYRDGYKFEVSVRYFIKPAGEPFTLNTAYGLQTAAEMLKGVNLCTQNNRIYQ